MATEKTRAGTTNEPDPDSSPFELPAIEGIPFDDDSEEARAIQRVIEDADRERAAAKRN